MVPEKFLKPYNPKETEGRIYKLWEQSGFFNPDRLPKSYQLKAKSFSIVMPPPNVTGMLHMGHALALTLEDIMVRFSRMRGKRTLWVPGTDHAAIATQAVVEKELYKKEGKTRHDLGRKEFLKRVEAFAAQSHRTITSQIRVMGASCDWSREAFTLDEQRSKAVRTMFKEMHDDGLIYRGNRIVNWDPKGQTTISDDEIVYEERKTNLYTFKYSTDFPIAIATTRPETKLGDVGVAVHPDDSRYKQYVGKTFEIADFAGVPLSIKVVADTAVDPNFGTGAVGLTPAHSQTDWDIATRHNLPQDVVIIDEHARMTIRTGIHARKKIGETREKVVEWLKKEGLLQKEEEVSHNVATAERTGGIIEPLPKHQWFVNVNKPVKNHGGLPAGAAQAGKTLKELMREPVANGEIKIIPEHFEKTYFHWIENLRDWCISRQIWYGHRIPAFCDLNLEENIEAVVVFQNTDMERVGLSKDQLLKIPEDKYTPRYLITATTTQLKADIIKKLVRKELLSWDWVTNHGHFNYSGTHSIKIEPFIDLKDIPESGIMDPDTLDTWFSSGLWTFSTLGWPEKTKDLEMFHPTDVLETGYEILFFWVARMILMSQYALGEIPFKTVYLHGTVRDARGRKMSKSLGNGIDPIDIAQKFGADAARMTLIVGNTPGTDMRISEDKIKAYKHFANKLWNIARFILENTASLPSPLFRGGSEGGETFTNLLEDDRKLFAALKALVEDVANDMDNFRFYLAAEKLYHYVWHTLADRILEESKRIFQEGSEEEKQSRTQFLLHTLDKLLKALHPFMPFVTEEIWQLWQAQPTTDHRPPTTGNNLLMIQPWPITTNY